jgi:hypothetical protein
MVLWAVAVCCRSTSLVVAFSFQPTCSCIVLLKVRQACPYCSTLPLYMWHNSSFFPWATTATSRSITDPCTVCNANLICSVLYLLLINKTINYLIKQLDELLHPRFCGNGRGILQAANKGRIWTSGTGSSGGGHRTGSCHAWPPPLLMSADEQVMPLCQ